MVHRVAGSEGKERLDLADDLPAGALGIENLMEKTKEGAADVIDPIAAVAALVGLRQKARRLQRLVAYAD